MMRSVGQLSSAVTLLTLLALKPWLAVSFDPVQPNNPSNKSQPYSQEAEPVVIATREKPDRQSTRRILQPTSTASSPLLADFFGGQPGFYHGVASGDPLPKAVIVWTRYTPVHVQDVITLELRMAEIRSSSLPLDAHLDPTRNPALIRALVTVEPSSDWVAKIDVTGLKSRTAYVFAFTNGVVHSEVGWTQTAPAEGQAVESLRYAVFSCSNLPKAYFHSYDVGSTIQNLDYKPSGIRENETMPNKEMVELQDYRLRYASYLHADEGHRQIRRRAPMIAAWDDHETTNNAWMNGAQNHNPSTEGDWGVRVNNAFQAYMEWLPIRHQPGSMGLIHLGSFTQVIEWGNLATIITFDTRISHRSKDPTMNPGTTSQMFNEFASTYTNVRDYSNPRKPAYTALRQLQQEANNILWNPAYEMVGQEYMDLLRTTFNRSKTAGKPWQIWGAQVMMGPQIAQDPDVIGANLPRLWQRALAPVILGSIYASPTDTGLELRRLRAMAEVNMTTNRDGFDGFSFERAKFLNLATAITNNLVVLGGDVHNAWGWTLYQDGLFGGKPVGINLICQGVGSGGTAALGSIPDVLLKLANADEIISSVHDATVKQIPNAKYVDYFYRGFFAVHVTQSKHVVEYFGIPEKTSSSHYTAARQESGGVTADFLCGGSFITTAGVRGSLERNPSGCGTVSFESQRLPILSIPVPNAPFPFGRDPLSDCGFAGCVLRQ